MISTLERSTRATLPRSTHISGFVPRLRLWVLLLGLVGGILAMHSLSGGDDAGHHGAMPGMMMAAPGMTMSSVEPTASLDMVSAMVVLVSDVGREITDDAGMDSCILFLTISGAALLLALISRRLARGTLDVQRLLAVALPTRWITVPHPPDILSTVCVTRI